MNDIQFFAEWEKCGAILMALPNLDTDWDYILKDAVDQYNRIINTFIDAGETIILLVKSKIEAEDILDNATSPNLHIVEIPFNDTWTRDYGPISVLRHGKFRALDFGFNAWGLKFASDKDNLVNLSLTDSLILNPSSYRNHRDFILEGGSIDTDGCGTILTTTKCLCSLNRNGGLTKSQANEYLQRYLGADHVLWLDYGALVGDDTDSHIDTLARMCPDNTILFTGCRDENDEHFEELLRMRAQLTLFRNKEGNPYNLIELPLPHPIFDNEGNRLPATYANYLVTQRNLYMPVYGQSDQDYLACQTVKIAFPNHKIIPIDCTTLLYQHGSLHCSTMQLPDEILIK
ncbi:MAG: agmatine deiminase family protein [Prevotella sp.]|nr:agmatine deiminase family protein [Bacteroides sp.]MCM1365620.1 agmatine deiminase family protein [Prevotella sp.]